MAAKLRKTRRFLLGRIRSHGQESTEGVRVLAYFLLACAATESHQGVTKGQVVTTALDTGPLNQLIPKSGQVQQ
jgi:hypothetical protein